MKTFQSDEQRALAYAAYKTLERMLEQDGELPPGYYKDLTGASITITLPKGSVVERDKGTNGDGSINKKAVQNLYGYGLWALMTLRLKKFNQWNAIRELMLDAMQEVVRRPTKDVKAQILKEFPEVAAEIEELQEQLEMPTRRESTPRLFKDTGLPATLQLKLN